MNKNVLTVKMFRRGKGWDFYYGLVEWSDKNSSYICKAWAWGKHFGEAIENMRAAAIADGIKKPEIVEVDYEELQDIPETALSYDQGISYISDETHGFPTKYVFRFPYGVMINNFAHEVDPEKIRPGYHLYPADDNGLIEIEAVVERDNLLKIYLDMVKTLPDINVFWLKLADDWESDEWEMFTNESLRTPAKIKKYVAANKVNSLMNGHLTLTTYSDTGATNLNISDHKTIVVLTYDKNLAMQLRKVLEASAIKKKKRLYAVSGGIQHYHFRHPESLNRKQLIKKLKTDGFKKWEPEA
jgi:hypothetical protein